MKAQTLPEAFFESAAKYGRKLYFIKRE